MRLNSLWALGGRHAQLKRRNARGSSQLGRLQVEALEGRNAPAGVVTTSQIGTTLVVTGIDDMTPAGVSGGLNNQAVIITGTGLGSITVAGDLGTTINGQTNFSGIDNIRFSMGFGNDTALVTSTISRAMSNSSAATATIRSRSGRSWERRRWAASWSSMAMATTA